MSRELPRPGARAATPRRWALAMVLCAGALAAFWALRAPVTAARDAGDPGPSKPEVGDWSDEVLELFGRLPVQDGGRVKPLSTWARFALLPMSHRSSCKTASGESRSALQWALDVMFHPEKAKTYPLFLVENDEVIVDLGLRFEDKKKRDRYSYNELEPGLQRLLQLGGRVSRQMHDRDLELSDFPPLEQGLFTLAINVREFQSLAAYLDFGRESLPVGDVPEVQEVFGGRKTVRFSDIVEKAPELRALATAEGPGHTAISRAVATLVNAAGSQASGSQQLRIFPPVKADERNWLTPWDVAQAAYDGKPAAAEHLAALRKLEDLTGSLGTGRFVAQLHSYHDAVVEMAKERGEYDKIPLEVSFYELAPFQWGMGFYFLGFLCMAVLWFKPRMKWFYRGVLVLLAVAFAFHVVGITLRCFVRERPPVSTLYETVIFVGAVAVLACFITERINRQRIAISLAPVLGFLALFMAQRYEALNQKDTMPQLVAVLDTNFWLTIHVLCITIGYSAGLLAGAFAHLHVLGRVFGLKRNSKTFYLNVGRMLYGTLCFALLFSVIGTITGGIWANDSWGRFWGWDPKENGALMICLWQAITLHARVGGYVKAHGLAMMSIFGTAVIAFSWWHVNLLGIGLHSYGFTQGILDNLKLFYWIEAIVLATGGAWWFTRRVGSGAAAA